MSVPDMAALEAAFRANVILQDRKYRLSTFKQSFIGAEAVDWLVASGHAASRPDAVVLGRALADSAFFEHVTRDHEFDDSPLFYHFVDAKSRGSAARKKDGVPVSWADFLNPAGANSGRALAPRFSLPDFEAVPEESAHVASSVWPLDQFNTKLLDNVHPPQWEDAPAGGGVYDVVVVGAGAGGLVTAAGAAGVGARVALVESHLLGGDCLNVGCVPSKALIHSANLAHAVRDTAALEESGITVTGVEVDFGKVMERMRRLRAEISENDSAERFTKKLGVDVFFGYGKFKSGRELEVNGRVLEFKKAVVATGGYPALLPIPGLKELFKSANDAKEKKETGVAAPAVMTNETVFNLTTRPRHLVVIGAGVIGMEIAQAMQRLGSQVTVLGRSGQVLPKEDKDLAALVKTQMESDGVDFRLSVKEYKSISRTGVLGDSGLPELALTIVEAASPPTKEKSEDQSSAKGTGSVLKCDALLIAAGRKPNVTGMGLENAGVKFDSKIGLTVNDNLQTSNVRIYGVGDCCSAFKFTHAADFMARMVIRNALFLGREKMSSLLIPYATFTSPEIASVGLYEADLKERGIAFNVFEKSFADNDRAICDSATTGMVRMRVDAKTDAILGATVCGAGAGNMISEITLAMQSGTGLGKLAAVIHPYPTTAESIRQAGDLYNRERLTTTVRSLLRGLIKVQR